MIDHDELDTRLRAYAARWQAEQPPAPRVDPQTLAGTYRRPAVWILVPVAMVAVALTIFAVLLIARPDTQHSNPPAHQQERGWHSYLALSSGPLGLRYGAAAVWTGDAMVVWGGAAEGGEQLFADGAAYDPARRTWETLPEAPLERRLIPTAVWTGEEMLIWGGFGWSDHGTNDGAAFDPETGAWRSLAPSPLSPRYGQAAVWTGTEMVVWGGVSSNGWKGDGAAYDPDRDSWRMLPRSPLRPGQDASAVWTGTEMIVWGGCTNKGTFATGAAYSPQTDKWRQLARSPLAPRCDTTAVWSGEEVIIWGGIGQEGRDRNDGAAYDPRTDRWRLIEAAPLEGRFGHVAVWADDRMLIWGGAKYDENFFDVALDDGAAYHPASDSWTRLPEAIVRARDQIRVPLLPRQEAVGVWTGTDLIVWGGYSSDDHGDGAAFRP